MPKMLQVRNVPDDVHRRLKARAAEAGVSLSDFVLVELEALAEAPPLAEVLRRARARRSLATPAEVVEIIREGRSGR